MKYQHLVQRDPNTKPLAEVDETVNKKLLLALIRHYFEAAQAMSPVALGNGTQPRGPLHIPEGDDSCDPCLPPNCTLRCPRLPVSPPSPITNGVQVLSD